MPVVLQPASPVASTTATQGIAVDDLVYRLVRECGDVPPDSVLTWRWLRDRYRRIWGACPWEFSKKEYRLVTVAPISSDSVTVTNASTTVTETTSDGKWTSSVIGRKFRRTADNTWYDISSYTNSNPDTLTLDRNYEGTSGATAGYKIFQDTYSLADDTGEITSIVNTSNGGELTQVTLQELDCGFPNRATTGTPVYYALAGRDSNNIMRVQLYPIPDAIRGFMVRYIQEAPFLVSGASIIIPQVFESLLVAGWKADYWSWRSTLTNPAPTGIEQAWYGTHESEFARELQEMVNREYRSCGPKRFVPHSRYTWHRDYRANKSVPRHTIWELP
jgi:hypothetical protein